MSVRDLMMMLTESPVFFRLGSCSSAEAEKHSVHDVVMPLPGFDVIYPHTVVRHSGKPGYMRKPDLYFICRSGRVRNS